MEYSRQALAELFVQRRHLLSQVVQGTTTSYCFGSERCLTNNVDQSFDGVRAATQRKQPLVAGHYCDHLVDNGVSQGFLAIEVVIQRALGNPGCCQNCVQSGTLETRFVNLLECCLQQAFPRVLWITPASRSLFRRLPEQ